MMLISEKVEAQEKGAGLQRCFPFGNVGFRVPVGGQGTMPSMPRALFIIPTPLTSLEGLSLPTCSLEAKFHPMTGYLCPVGKDQILFVSVSQLRAWHTEAQCVFVELHQIYRNIPLGE